MKKSIVCNCFKGYTVFVLVHVEQLHGHGIFSLQIFDLSPTEQQWLTNHLGHSMDVHKIHYRQTAGLIERVDLAKLMLIQEFNVTAKYAGQKLSDIQFTGKIFDKILNLCLI